MANSASLVVQIKANATALNNTLKKAKASSLAFASTVANKVGTAFVSFGKRAVTALTSILRTIRNVSLALTALSAISFAKVIGKINMTSEAIDKMAKISDKLGVPIEKLQELQFIAGQTGVSTQTFNTALQRQVRRISEAANGYGVAVKALQELKININDIKNLSPEQQFLKLSEAMKKVKSQSDRVRLSNLLFDTEGVDLVNTLTADLGKLGKEYRALGVTITRSQAAQVEAYNDSKAAAGQLFDSISTKVTAEVAPAFKSFIDSIAESVVAYGGLDKVANRVGRFIVSSSAYIVGGFASMVDGINSAINAFLKLGATAKSVYGFIVESQGRANEGSARTRIGEAQQSLATEQASSSRLSASIQETQGQITRAQASGDTAEVQIRQTMLSALQKEQAVRLQNIETQKKAIAQAERDISAAIKQQQAGQELGSELAKFETVVNPELKGLADALRKAENALHANTQASKDTSAAQTVVAQSTGSIDTRSANSLIADSQIINSLGRTLSDSISLNIARIQNNQQPVVVNISGDIDKFIQATVDDPAFAERTQQQSAEGIFDAARNVRK